MPKEASNFRPGKVRVSQIALDVVADLSEPRIPYGRVADAGSSKALPQGDEYSAGDVVEQPLLNGAQVATYCAQVCEGGRAHARPIGVMVVHFDWQPQAQAIMDGIRVSPEDRGRTRVLLVDAHRRVIAASDRRGILTERLPISLTGRDYGFDRAADGTIWAFHRTPGYETYRGLGWCGVIQQYPATNRR